MRSTGVCVLRSINNIFSRDMYIRMPTLTMISDDYECLTHMLYMTYMLYAFAEDIIGVEYVVYIVGPYQSQHIVQKTLSPRWSVIK